MWERTLQDLIRGLRANRNDEAKFIAQAMGEIREEIKGKDMELKAAAVLKLTYLDMLGYDMKWASFYVVEVMSSSRLHLKGLGYLAATQSFRHDTDVLMLTTNLLKKDLGSSPNDIVVALDGLSNIVDQDLARDLSRDIYAMLNHSRAHIRKRAVLVLYKIFLRFPETLDQNFARLKEKLEDPDPGVVSATVNVLCELARRRPQDYLPLAPLLFHLLTSSTNNWMLIKVIKLFGYLAPCEPRLVKKLHNPMLELIGTTPAISLLYECVHTCIIGGMLEGASGNQIANTCVTKLSGFLEDADQNLKYIALLALVKIAPSHPHLMTQYQDIILASIGDTDMTIRLRALDLLAAMVDSSNVQVIVQQLLAHLLGPQSNSVIATSAIESLQRTASGLAQPSTSDVNETLTPAYRLDVSKRILGMCELARKDGFDNMEWLLSVYVDLAYVSRVDIGAILKDSLMQAVLHDDAIRRHAVKLMSKLLNDDVFVQGALDSNTNIEVLSAAAWICGEYCNDLQDPLAVLRSLQSSISMQLPGDALADYLWALVKIFGHWGNQVAARWDDQQYQIVSEAITSMKDRIQGVTSHPELLVQEIAMQALQMLLFVQIDFKNFNPQKAGLGNGLAHSAEPTFPKSLCLISPLFSSHLHPHSIPSTTPPSPPIPLGDWIVPSEKPAPKPDRTARLATSTFEPIPTVEKKKKGKRKAVQQGSKAMHTIGEDTQQLAVQERKLQQQHNPYYIKDEQPSTSRGLDDLEDIPIVHLDLSSTETSGHASTATPLEEYSDESSPFAANWDTPDPSGDYATPLPVMQDTSQTPETFVVTKVKKKKASTKKKG